MIYYTCRNSALGFKRRYLYENLETDGCVFTVFVPLSHDVLSLSIDRPCSSLRQHDTDHRNTDRNDLTLVDHVIIVDGASGIGEHASESVIHTLSDILFFGEIDFIFLIYRIIIPQFSAFGKRIGTGFVFVTKISQFFHFCAA